MRAKATGVLSIFLLFLLIFGLDAERRDLSAQNAGAERVIVRDVEMLGQASIPIGLLLEGTEIGGFSALTYDPMSDVYYVLSDDRSERDPARYYTVKIDLNSGPLTNSDVTFEQVTTLRQPDNQPFPPGGIDPEGIALSPGGTLFISSEGAPLNLTPVQPFVNEFDLNGRQVRQFTIPTKFEPDDVGAEGIRNNLAFESAAVSPNARYVYTAVENALAQDGPVADIDTVSLSRVIQFDRIVGTAVQEIVYPVGPAQAAVSADIPQGLVDIAPLDDNGTFLALERGPSQGFGLSVLLYQAHFQGALNVGEVDDLVWDDSGDVYEIDDVAAKEVLLDFAELGLPFVNNFEGMTLGPVLPDGRQVLVLVSDNNFSIVPTEFVALALTLETVPAAFPTMETQQFLDQNTAPIGSLAGEAVDPAIWLHPDDTSESMVALALGNGGLIMLDLAGNVVQHIAPVNYGDLRFNNTDVIYDFPLGPEKADLVVVSDGQSDSLVVFRIDAETREMVDITSAFMPETLFGPDDGVHTANRLTIYTSARDGAVYAFVSQDAGNLVVQVQLLAGADGLVFGEIVRTLVLPNPLGDPAEAAATGLVADRFFGNLYVGQRGGQGILKFDAEPEKSNDYTVFGSPSDPDLPIDAGGLAIYYGAGNRGYLVATNPNNQSFAVFSRADNTYIGSFIIPDDSDIDQVNRAGGLELINTPVGPFSNGLLIVTDSTNDPQNVVAEGPRLHNISTNFKLLGWDTIADAFPSALTIDTSTYNPRTPMRVLLPMLTGN